MKKLKGVVSQMPDYFHKDTYGKIFAALKRGENVQLIGFKRCGKSFLLRNLEANQDKLKKANDFPELSRFYICDMELLADGSMNTVLKHVFGPLLGSDIHSLSNAEVVAKISDFFAGVRERGEIIVMAMDTIEKLEFLKSYDFFNYLNALHKENTGFLRFVFSFDRPVDFRKSKEIYGDLVRLMIGRPIYVRRMNAQESEWFINANNDLVPDFRIAKNVKNEILKESAGFMPCIKRLFEAAVSGEDVDYYIQNPDKLPGLSYNIECMLDDVSDEKETLRQLVLGEEIAKPAELEVLRKYELIDGGHNLTCSVIRNYLMNKYENKNVSFEEKIGDITIKSKLTGSEYKLLEFLGSKKGEIVSRDSVIEHVWGSKSALGISDAALNQIILRIRKKLSASGSKITIETLRGRGFVLEDIS